MLACSFVGSPEAVREELGSFVKRTGADELIVAAAIHDHAARLRSYELLAGTQTEDAGAVANVVGIRGWRNLRLVPQAKTGVGAPAEITP